MNKGRIWFLLALGFMVLLTGCGRNAEKSKADEDEKIFSVQTVKPRYAYYTDSVSFSGITVPDTITKASFLVSGRIVSLRFKVGDYVEKGDVLAEIDPEIYRRQVDVAGSAVTLAEANRKKVERGSRDQEIEMAGSQMIQARSNLELAKKEKERFDRLYEIDAIPRQQYDRVCNSYDVALQQYTIASERYDLVKEGASGEDKAIASASVGVNQAQLAQAENQLRYTRLLSPVSGIISEKSAEVGIVTAPGVPVYEIQSANAVDFETFVPSIHIDRIKTGRRAEIRFIDNSHKPVSAVIKEIRPMTDEKTKSYRVKMKMRSQPGSDCMPGMIGEAVFTNGDKIHGAFVPLSCVIRSNGDKDRFIYVVNDGIARKVPVKVLKIKDQEVMIDGGFSKNSGIVLSGQEYLSDSCPVRIVRAYDAQDYVSPDRKTESNDLYKL